MELKGLKINFLGDSITEGVGVPSPYYTYHQVLKRNAGLAEARNYGVSGTRIALQIHPTEGAPSFDETFLERAKRMDRDADAVVVFGGTNDFGHGDAPIGTPSDRTPNTFYGALHCLYSYLISEFPSAAIVVITPTHRLNEWRTNGDNNQKSYNYGCLKDYVNIIREVAEFYSLHVLDMYATGGIQPNIEAQRLLYMPDGLHPNENGNARIAARLEAFLKTL